MIEDELMLADITDAIESADENSLPDALIAALLGLRVFTGITWGGENQRVWLSAISNSAQSQLLQLYSRLQSGAISPTQFTAFAETVLRRHWLQAAVLGRGGEQAITANDLRVLNRYWLAESGFMREFVAAMPDLSEAQIKQRLRMYGDHVQTPFYEMRRGAALDAGFTQERRHINAKHSCSDCPVYEAEGWRPIGTLPPPGQDCECLSNCKCSMAYR